jgi:hypothetical protein
MHILVAFYDTHELRWGYSLLRATTRGRDAKFWSENLKGNSKHKWDSNINVNLREVMWEGANCINLAQDRFLWRAVVYTVLNIRVP